MKSHWDQINEIGLIETKLFHIHRILKTGDGAREPPLDPPLLYETRSHLERCYLCRNQAEV